VYLAASERRDALHGGLEVEDDVGAGHQQLVALVVRHRPRLVANRLLEELLRAPMHSPYSQNCTERNAEEIANEKRSDERNEREWERKVQRTCLRR
jgi:hypothetical protein